MPGDIRSEEFGPFPYHYESLFNHHPDQGSGNEGCAEEWKKDKSNEQVRRVLENMREQYKQTDLNIG